MACWAWGGGRVATRCFVLCFCDFHISHLTNISLIGFEALVGYWKFHYSHKICCGNIHLIVVFFSSSFYQMKRIHVQLPHSTRTIGWTLNWQFSHILKLQFMSSLHSFHTCLVLFLRGLIIYFSSTRGGTWT